jgi:WD40 repeat protein
MKRPISITLSILSVTLGLGLFGQCLPASTAGSTLPALQGEAALNPMKERGLYGSLQEAVTIAAPHFSQWSEPVNLGPTINSPFAETAPTLSKDGRSLYFSSTRPCGAGDATLDLNIWVARRNSTEESWNPPECLEINVDGFEDSAAAFSRDGHWMFFVSDRPGSLGAPGFNGRDIWVSWRSDVHDDHAWGEPFNAGPAINTTTAEAGPTYFENEGRPWPQLFFTSIRNGTFDIWVSDVLGDGQFGPPSRVNELSTGDLVEARPSIGHDGLELFFFRGPGGAIFDIYAASRPDPTAPWSEPVNLGAPVNTGANEQQPSISSDRKMLFFASNRPGTFGNLDIWVSTRVKAK